MKQIINGIIADGQKLTLPSRQETLRTSVLVLGVMLVLSVLLAFFDSIFRNLILTFLSVSG